MDPVESLPFKILSDIASIASIGVGFVFSELDQSIVKWADGKNPNLRIGKLAVQNPRGLGAIIVATLCFHSAVVTLWHFVELSQKPNDATRATAIISEVSKLASSVSRIAYAFAVNDEEEDSRQVAIAVMAVSNYAFSDLQVTEAASGSKALSHSWFCTLGFLNLLGVKLIGFDEYPKGVQGNIGGPRVIIKHTSGSR